MVAAIQDLVGTILSILFEVKIIQFQHFSTLAEAYAKMHQELERTNMFVTRLLAVN